MKVKGLRWMVIGLIMLITIINYLDRGTLNYMWVANIDYHLVSEADASADKGNHAVLAGEQYILTAAQFGRNILKDEIKWSQHKAMSYLSTIELRGIDRTGILLDLAKTVSEDFSINIRQINIQTHDNIFEGTISLYVKDAEGLHAIMDKIRKIKGIDTVKRNQD